MIVDYGGSRPVPVFKFQENKTAVKQSAIILLMNLGPSQHPQSFSFVALRTVPTTTHSLQSSPQLIDWNSHHKNIPQNTSI